MSWAFGPGEATLSGVVDTNNGAFNVTGTMTAAGVRIKGDRFSVDPGGVLEQVNGISLDEGADVSNSGTWRINGAYTITGTGGGVPETLTNQVGGTVQKQGTGAATIDNLLRFSDAGIDELPHARGCAASTTAACAVAGPVRGLRLNLFYSHARALHAGAHGRDAAHAALARRGQQAPGRATREVGRRGRSSQAPCRMMDMTAAVTRRSSARCITHPAPSRDTTPWPGATRAAPTGAAWRSTSRRRCSGIDVRGRAR